MELAYHFSCLLILILVVWAQLASRPVHCLSFYRPLFVLALLSLVWEQQPPFSALIVGWNLSIEQAISYRSYQIFALLIPYPWPSKHQQSPLVSTTATVAVQPP
jgi:hypothetical protein